MVRILSILLFLVIFSEYSYSQDFAVRLLLPKDTFQVFETIDLDVQLINNRNKIDSVYLIQEYELTMGLNIQNLSTGEKPQYSGIICALQAYVTYTKFLPKETKKISIDLLFSWANKYIHNKMFFSTGYLSAGNYSIECEWMFSNERFQKKTIAPKIYLTIVNPNEDNAITLQKFENILNYNPKDSLESFKYKSDICEFIKNNIHSIYLDRFFHPFVFYVGKEDLFFRWNPISKQYFEYGKQTEILKLILENRANDKVASQALNFIKYNMEHLSFNMTFKEFLKYYSEKLDGTKIALEMKEMLKTL